MHNALAERRTNTLKETETMAKAVQKIEEKDIDNVRLCEQAGCRICMANYSNTLLTSCNHVCCCGPCSLKLIKCPICNVKIVSRKVIYH